MSYEAMTQTQLRRDRRLRAHKRAIEGTASDGGIYSVKVHHDGHMFLTDKVRAGRYRR